MHPQRGHRCRIPHFVGQDVVKISLTYKTGLLILRPAKRKFLSKTSCGEVAGAAGCAWRCPKCSKPVAWDVKTCKKWGTALKTIEDDVLTLNLGKGWFSGLVRRCGLLKLLCDTRRCGNESKDWFWVERDCVGRRGGKPSTSDNPCFEQADSSGL